MYGVFDIFRFVKIKKNERLNVIVNVYVAVDSKTLRLLHSLLKSNIAYHVKFLNNLECIAPLIVEGV